MKSFRVVGVMAWLILLRTSAIAQDTLWIDPNVPGMLESTINGDVVPDGSRNNPHRVYGLHKDAVYIQTKGISFHGGGTLTIVGEKGGAYPVVQMQPSPGTGPADPWNSVANTIEGSLHLEHLYWIGKTVDSLWYGSMFSCTTVDDLPQSLVINDCIMEFGGTDWVTALGWDHGASFRISESYFRDLFQGVQWWNGRVFNCPQIIDTLWVENSTFSDAGLTFLQRNALCTFAYFNHNTLINNNKYWLMNSYNLTLFITNNLFVNQNWVGEDTVNVTVNGFDPDSLLMGTINIDTIKSGILMPSGFRNPDGTVNQSAAGPDRLKIFVSNNIAWTDTILNAYYTNRNNAWNSVGPYPLSYLNWAGKGNGPWQVKNVPGIWANRRTQELIAAYPHNMAMTENIFTRVNTRTPAIANAGVAALMAQWNQNQWGDPAAPSQVDLRHSAYTFGDQNAGTIPGYRNGSKTEDGTSGVAKISDFLENFAQAGTPVLSAIDNLPIGSLIWQDETIPAGEDAKVAAAFQAATGYVSPQPPAPPVAMPATNILRASFTANWTISARATAYQIDVALDSGFTGVLAGYRDLHLGNILAENVTGLSAATTYYYRVRASNEGGQSGSSNCVAVTTSSEPLPPTAPLAKAATAVSSTSFIANWDNSSGATGYLLDVATDSGFVSLLGNYHNRNVGNVLSANVSGLAESTAYFYRVRAASQGGTSGPSNVIAVTTTGPPPPPPAPVATPATKISSASFTANWDSSAGATEYRLDVSTDSSFASLLSGFDSLNVGQALSYGVTGLKATTRYSYRIRAATGRSMSGFSNIVSVTTTVGPPPPPAPVALGATDITSSSFVARWDSSAGATEYRVDVAADSLFAAFWGKYNDLLVSNGLVLNVTGLRGGRRYFYRVRAGKIGSMSANSNSVEVSTTASQDTIWIDADSAGVLETTINADTDAIGQRNNPNRVYALNEGQNYLQRTSIVCHNPTGCLTICGIPSFHGTTKPMIVIDPLPGRPIGDSAVNSIWGSLTIRNVHYQTMQTDGRVTKALFTCGTAAGIAQWLRIDNCLFEFCRVDLFDCSNEPGAIGGWPNGAKFFITNSYFRNMFHPASWSGSRIAQCTYPIDTLWIENCTVANGGTVFLQRNQLADFMYVNHNTFINTTKNWSLSSYHHNLWITNNIFVNQNWTGEDTNVTASALDPDRLNTSTITIDTNNATNGLTTQPRYWRDDSTRFTPSLDLPKLHVYVSDNVNFTSPELVNGYYLSSKYRLSCLDALPSYLDWAGAGHGPWRIRNLPGAWMNSRTVRLFEAYGPGNGGMYEKRTAATDPHLVTNPIASPDIVDSMAVWNQHQWGDPRFPSPSDLVHTRYVYGDYDPTTYPGMVNGVKTDKATLITAGISEFTDLTENFAQHSVISLIDGLPVGSLIWDNALNAAFNSAADWNLVFARYIVDAGWPIGIAENGKAAPLEFGLRQNYPNPFNPTTVIGYQVPCLSRVRLVVYDVLGREVAVLVNEMKPPGRYEIRFDASGLSTGVYFYRIHAGIFVQTRKSILLR